MYFDPSCHLSSYVFFSIISVFLLTWRLFLQFQEFLVEGSVDGRYDVRTVQYHFGDPPPSNMGNGMRAGSAIAINTLNKLNRPKKKGKICPLTHSLFANTPAAIYTIKLFPNFHSASVSPFGGHTHSEVRLHVIDRNPRNRLSLSPPLLYRIPSALDLPSLSLPFQDPPHTHINQT